MHHFPSQRVLRKTAAGQEALNQRAPMAGALRMLLITVDGRRSCGELLKLAGSLGLGPEAFGQLQALGWVAPLADEPRGAPAPAVAAALPADGAAQVRAMAAARMFAIDLAARMLAGRDAAVRAGWREANTPQAFQRWLEDCAAHIANDADEDRAALFRQRVHQVLEAA